MRRFLTALFKSFLYLRRALATLIAFMMLNCAPMSAFPKHYSINEIVKGPPPALLQPMVSVDEDEIQIGSLPARYKIWHLDMHGNVNNISVALWVGDLKKAIDSGAKAVVINIDSEGGMIDAGFRFSQEIERAPIQVVCVVDRQAQSEAFYILQSCDKRLMTKRAMLMVHEPYWPAGTNLGQMDRHRLRDLLNDLDTDVASWTEHAGSKMKIGPDGLRKKISVGEDWRMAFKEALREQAVDGVVLSVQDVEHSMAATMSVNLLDGH